MPFENPYRPGAGHRPPYLAGRQEEIDEFSRLLYQSPILENLVLTGLRGVGKTVLLDEFKPIALSNSWIWVGSDLSETTSVSETNLAVRLLTDLSVFTTAIVISTSQVQTPGFMPESKEVEHRLDFDFLKALYEATPGLVSDKLKGVLELIASHLPARSKGIIFAYDESQNLSDNAERDQYPLSVLLDVFQSIQRKGIPFMLVLAGLPTLFPKLVEARTYAERMFRVVFLDQLAEADSREAILKPLEKVDCPVRPNEPAVRSICEVSGGYPYFIQFVCREVYDVWVSDAEALVPIAGIVNKLDTDFFAGRWARATDRQRELLVIIAQLPNADAEFSVQEIVGQSKHTEKPFSNSHVNQMLSVLAERGLIYKNRHGKYSFAVPLLARFIRRQTEFDSSESE